MQEKVGRGEDRRGEWKCVHMLFILLSYMGTNELQANAGRGAPRLSVK